MEISSQSDKKYSSQNKNKSHVFNFHGTFQILSDQAYFVNQYKYVIIVCLFFYVKFSRF